MVLLNPVPRALFVQGFVGAVFAGNNIGFAFLLFTAHYTIAWMASTINTLPPEEMFDHILGWHGPFSFAWGSFSGQILVYALRTRPLVPTLTMAKRSPRLAPVLAVFGATILVRATTILTGAANTGTDFFNLDSGDRIGYAFAVGLSALIFVGVLVLTWLQHAPSKMWKWLFFSYDDGLQSNIISEYIVAVILLLTPQLAWHFLIMPPASWVHEAAAALTLVLEAVVWVAFYFWFSRVRNVETTHFAYAESYATFFEFVLTMGLSQLVFGVFYLVVGYLPNEVNFPEFAVTGMLIGSVVASIILYIVLGFRRIAQRRANPSKARGSGAEDPFDQQKPTNGGGGAKLLTLGKRK